MGKKNVMMNYVKKVRMLAKNMTAAEMSRLLELGNGGSEA